MSAKDWYLRQSQRDRLVIIGLVALVVVALFFAMVWMPLARGIDSGRRTVVNNEQVIQQMLESEAIAKSLRGNSGNSIKRSNKAPYLLVDDIIRRLQMRNPDRVEPIGTTGARVNFSAVEFDKLIMALAQLEEFGLKISTLNVSRKEPGIVGARFRVDKN